MQVKFCGLDGPIDDNMREAMLKFSGDCVKRSLDQNACFHGYIRQITSHFLQIKQRVTVETVKEGMLLTLGNTREWNGQKVAMRTSQYKAKDEELTPVDRKHGIISMNELLTNMEQYASEEWELILK